MFAFTLLIFKTSFVNVICLDQRLSPFQNTVGHPLDEIIGDYSTGVRVLDVYLSFDPPMGLYDCALECSCRTRCKSFNYSSKMKYCELSHVAKVDGNMDSNTDASNAFIHSDIDSWKMHMNQGCDKFPCPENMKCDSKSGNCSYSDCGPSENIPNMLTNTVANNAVGLSSLHRCVKGFEMTDENGTVVDDGELVALCNDKAEWERHNFKCKEKVFAVRLVEKQSDRVGRVEVNHNNKWGQLVDKDWTDKDATVACKSLGYSGGKALSSLSQGYGVIWSNDFMCTGIESKLDDCRKGYWKSSLDLFSNGAVASCDPVRLAESSSDTFGKVEIYENGQWWSLCGDMWSQENSDVICKALGHRKAFQSFFLEREDSMIFDKILCSGNEDVINKCKRSPLAVNKCPLPKAVGVVCDVVNSTICEDGWIHKDGHCYFFSSISRSWSDSREYCKKEDGDLAKVNNDDEHDFIMRYIQTTVSDNDRSFWIGGNNQLAGSQWKWVIDMSDIKYNKWGQNQPDNGNQHCLVIWNDKHWHDDMCPNKRKFVCMKQANVCRRPHDCQDIHTCFNISGVHTIYPGNGKIGYSTFCDMDNDNKQWTLIMKRKSDSDFNEDWNQYKYGFGDPLSNTYWIGNEALYQITRTTLKNYRLKIKMNTSTSGMQRFLYEDISFRSESDNYRLDFVTLDDVFILLSKGNSFATKDKGTMQKCAAKYNYGWWFSVKCGSDVYNLEFKKISMMIRRD